jgi:hypothetical protein
LILLLLFSNQNTSFLSTLTFSFLKTDKKGGAHLGSSTKKYYPYQKSDKKVDRPKLPQLLSKSIRHSQREAKEARIDLYINLQMFT